MKLFPFIVHCHKSKIVNFSCVFMLLSIIWIPGTGFTQSIAQQGITITGTVIDETGETWGHWKSHVNFRNISNTRNIRRLKLTVSRYFHIFLIWKNKSAENSLRAVLGVFCNQPKRIYLLFKSAWLSFSSLRRR